MNRSVLLESELVLIQGFKGEFEAEGLSRDELASEVIFALRNGIDYLVKVSGAEAKSDYRYLDDIGVLEVVCPMIESPFAMQKYMSSIEGMVFTELGVTIETKTAIENIEAILDAGNRLTNVTVGRTDLAASMGLKSVNDPEILRIVKLVGNEAKKRGLLFSIGGSVDSKTQQALNSDSELKALIDFVETRKVVFATGDFLQDSSIHLAFKVERLLLDRRSRSLKDQLFSNEARVETIKSRGIN